MSDLLNKASLVIVPSGYKEDTVYSVVPTDGSGDLSFTRASNGTRVNSAGLVEVCPWNLASDSNSFGGLSAITKTTGQSSPFDSTSGNLLTATGSGEHYSGTASLTVIAGNTYTYSVYGKFVQGVNLALRTVFANGDADISTIWNLNTGALVLNAGDHQNPTITNVGNGWYRCSITYTPATVPAFPLLFRLQMAVGTNLSFTATTGDGFVAYGAQINNGAIAPYFPTTDRLNVPRLTYQNGGGGCPSLLLEKQSTNVLTQSNVLTGVSGTTATANDGISPDGTQNAILINGTSGYAYAGTSNNFGGGVISTFSAFLKYKQGIGQASIGIGGAFSAYLYIDGLDDGNIVLTNYAGSGVSGVTTGYEVHANGWYRFWLTATYTGSPGYEEWQIATQGSNTQFWYYGGQNEASSYMTSYIPTSGTSATRVADACYKTGISSLIGGGTGTWFMDFEMQTGTGTEYPFAFDLSDGTTSNRLFLYYAELFNSWYWGGVDTAITLPSTLRKKVAIKYSSGTAKLFCNGSFIGTNILASAFSRLDIGQRFSNTYPMDGKIHEAFFLTTSLTDAECQALTTI